MTERERAEYLTRKAEETLRRAAEAWNTVGDETKRDDCYRARSLRPGAMP